MAGCLRVVEASETAEAPSATGPVIFNQSAGRDLTNSERVDAVFVNELRCRRLALRAWF